MKVNLPFIGTSSPDETYPWLRNERINWYPENAPNPADARSPVILRTAAGLVFRARAGGGIVRGMRVMGEYLYVVAGQRLYRFDVDFNRTNLGTILGTNRVGMTDQFIPDTSRQLIIGTGDRGYVYDTSTGLAEIVDANFTSRASKKTPVSVGGYTVWDTPDGILWSDVQQPTVYPGLNFLTAETVTDETVGIALVNGEVWIGGGRSTEVRRLSGQSGADAFTLAQTIDYGWASPHGHISADNRFWFLETQGRVFTATGYACQRASDHQIEQWLSGLTTAQLEQAWLFEHEDRGHQFVGVSIPDTKTELFDIATKVWSRRKSKGVERWRVNAHAYFNGENLFGNYLSGRFWALDPNFVGEGNGDPFTLSEDELERELYLPFVAQDGDFMFLSMLDVLAQVGRAKGDGLSIATDPVMEMRYADVEGEWSAFDALPIGKIGEYATRLRWARLGCTRQRLFHLRITDPVRCDLITATLAGEVES